MVDAVVLRLFAVLGLLTANMVFQASPNQVPGIPSSSAVRRFNPHTVHRLSLKRDANRVRTAILCAAEAEGR